MRHKIYSQNDLDINRIILHKFLMPLGSFVSYSDNIQEEKLLLIFDRIEVHELRLL